MIYGIIIVFLFVGASAATLAEIASVYPTAGVRTLVTHCRAILTGPRANTTGLLSWHQPALTVDWYGVSQTPGQV